MIYAFGAFEFDEARWELRDGHGAVEIPPKVMQVLGVLLANRDRVVSSAELRARLWPNVTVTDGSIRKSIRIARKVLIGDAGAEHYIKTPRGRGYRFVADVKERAGVGSGRPLAAGARSVGPGASNSHPFVGREVELAELLGGLQQAFAGRPSFLLVAGDAGLGKTRLAEAFTAAAEDRGARVTWGRCCEEGGAPELWPWIQIVRALVGSHGPASITDPTIREVSRILPEAHAQHGTAEAWPGLTSESARFRFFDAVVALLRRAAESRPLVVILEDLHTADEASLLLARFLAREVKDAGVVVVATYRPTDVASAAPLSQLFGRLVREARVLSLAGLPEHGTRRLMAAALGVTPNLDLVSRVHQVTEGNPLFISEVLCLMATSEAQLSAFLERREVPNRIFEAIQSRFDGVSVRGRDLLSIAAVIGREFDIPVLQRVSDMSQTDVTSALEAALERKIIAEQPGLLGTCRFTHMLLRDVLYEALSITKRAELHARVGEVLESLSSAGGEQPAAQIAHHFSRATLGAGSERAAIHSMAAGKQALRSLAFEEAARHFERALDALRFERTRQPLCSDILVSLGEAQRLMGDYKRASGTFMQGLAVARGIDDPIRVAKAACGYAQVNLESGVVVNQDVITVLREAARRLERSTDASSPEAGELLSVALSRLAA